MTDNLREQVAEWLQSEYGERTWASLDGRERSEWRNDADSILQLLAGEGVVRLDSDQSLPDNPFQSEAKREAFGFGQLSMKANFRRVHPLSEKEGE